LPIQRVIESTSQRIAWDLYPLFDPRGAPENSLNQLIAGGVRVVQLRMKGASTAEIAQTARALLPRCRAAGVALIVNDDAEACRAADADGLHVGQGDMPPRQARAVIGAGRVIGVSTHSRAQFEAALREPVDYIAVGPVFGTMSKENPDPIVGLELVRWARARTDRPLVAIGGIDASNIAAVLDAGADIVAVIGALAACGDLTAEVRRLRAAWSGRGA